MSKWGKVAHKRVAKAVGYALTLGDGAAWQGLTLILASRLSEAERAGLAYAALSSLPDDHAYKVASLAIYGVLNGEVAK